MYKFKNVHVIVSDGGEDLVDSFAITDQFKGRTFRDFTEMAKAVNDYLKTTESEGDMYAGYEKIGEDTLRSIVPIDGYESLSNKGCHAYVTMEYEKVTK